MHAITLLDFFLYIFINVDISNSASPMLPTMECSAILSQFISAILFWVIMRHSLFILQIKIDTHIVWNQEEG
jgi:hypothetical protein